MLRRPFDQLETLVSRTPYLAGLAGALSLAALACGPSTAPPGAAVPTAPSAAITAGDLKTRLSILADDSMQGRRAGTQGNVKGTDYIAAEARRIGLQPAGENGGWFQTVPLVERGIALRQPPRHPRLTLLGGCLRTPALPAHASQHRCPVAKGAASPEERVRRAVACPLPLPDAAACSATRGVTLPHATEHQSPTLPHATDHRG